MKFNYKIWCKLFNVLSVWWYIKFYDVFVFFCCFTARSICATPITFFEWGDLERTRHLLATWQDSRWRRIFAWSFLFQVFYGNRFVIEILMKMQQISNVTDGHGLKWCIKMDKPFVLDYLSPCFIKLGVVWLCIFCVVMQLPESYENKRFRV